MARGLSEEEQLPVTRKSPLTVDEKIENHLKFIEEFQNPVINNSVDHIRRFLDEIKRHGYTKEDHSV